MAEMCGMLAIKLPGNLFSRGGWIGSVSPSPPKLKTRPKLNVILPLPNYII